MIVEAQFTIAQAVAGDTEVLAIGDVHGEANLLEQLLGKAESLPPAGRRVLVFTGDLIDRGPRGHEVLRIVARAGSRVGADESVMLMGNHEQMLLCALEGRPARRLDAYGLWIANGGDALLEEVFGRDWMRFHGPERLREALGDSVDVLRAMRSHWRSGDVLFVHAGVSPDMPLAFFLSAPWDVDFPSLREEGHWAWIREPFLDAKHHGGLFVVHGHTPHDNATRSGPATVSRDRLNLDLGTGRTGRLRMARLVGTRIAVFDACRDR